MQQTKIIYLKQTLEQKVIHFKNFKHKGTY